MHLFGQILAALYQDDVVEEDDIRSWHKKPSAQGEGVKPPASEENLRKCWNVGAHMIKQFDEQESEEGSEDEDKDSAPARPAMNATPQATLGDDEEDEDEDEEEDEEDEEE